MKLPVDIRFAGIPPLPAVEAGIRQRVAHFERDFPDALAWRVKVEQLHRPGENGGVTVRIAVQVPGGELVVRGMAEDDVHAAVRDAFEALRPKLRDHDAQVHRELEQHELPGRPRWSDEEGP